MTKIPERSDNDIIESASVTALMRYLLSNENGLASNPDNLGHFFVNGKWRKYLDTPLLSRNLLQEKLPGCIYYHLVRTKNFDYSLLKWIKQEKNSQVIILGTGFDTRPIRFNKELTESRITVYEVDLRAMLTYKERVISQSIGCTLDNVIYVPCNFQKNNIIEELAKHNFKFDKPTLILWEGVTYFLTQQIFEDYLGLFKKNLEGSLKITFDYAFRDYINGNLNFYGAKELSDVLVELGEPHLFGLNYDEVEAYFDGKGYSTTVNNTSFMLEALYIKDSYGNSVGKPHAFHGMAEIVKN